MESQSRTITCQCKERLKFIFRKGLHNTRGRCPYCKTNITLRFESDGLRSGKVIEKSFEGEI